jgi:hypothetical protein
MEMDTKYNMHTEDKKEQKQAVLCTLVHRSEPLETEKAPTLRATFMHSSYCDEQVSWAINLPVIPSLKKQVSVTFLALVSMTFSRTSRILSRHNTKYVGPLP